MRTNVDICVAFKKKRKKPTWRDSHKGKENQSPECSLLTDKQTTSVVLVSTAPTLKWELRYEDEVRSVLALLRMFFVGHMTSNSSLA